MPTKKTWILIAVAVSGYIIGPVCGRFTAPVKVVAEVKIEYQDRIVEKEVIKVHTVYTEKRADAKNVYTKKTETIEPDGTKTVTTESHDTSKSLTETGSAVALAASRDVEATRASTQASRQETTSERPRNTLVLMGGFDLKLRPSYGLSYTRNLIGPFGVGIWYVKAEGHGVGLNLGLTF